MEADFLAMAIGALGPGEFGLRQNRLAELAHHFRLRLPNPSQKCRIGFQNSELGIVQENEILDRFKSVAPLPVGTQDFFDQMQVFKRQAELLRTSGQERHLVGSVGLWFVAAEYESSHHGLFPRHCGNDDLLKLLALENW